MDINVIIRFFKDQKNRQKIKELIKELVIWILRVVITYFILVSLGTWFPNFDPKVMFWAIKVQQLIDQMIERGTLMLT